MTKVLLIEDQEDIRLLLSYFIVMIKSKLVGEANNARDGVIQASAMQPNLILLDIGMPGLSAFKAIPLLKKACVDVKIIVLSGYPAMEAKARKSGADHFIKKNEKMCELIKEYIDKLEQSAIIAP